jgi:AraC family ethanolamine operon transcriptional activator
MRREFHDFDELSDAVHGFGLDWTQLDRGELKASIQQTTTRAVLCSRFRFSRKFHQRGTTPPGVRTVGFVGRQSPEVRWRRGVGTHGHFVVFPTDAEFEFVSEPGFHGDTVSFSEERIRSVAEALEVADPLDHLPDGQDIVASDPQLINRTRTRLTRLHAAVAEDGTTWTDPSSRSELEFETLAVLATAFTAIETERFWAPEPTLRSRALSAALDFIRAHADDSPTIEEICRASGAGLRTLEYAFRDRFDVTPKQYLRAMRLKRVRKDLLRAAPDRPVSEVAAHRGFWHMGQFAADYRRQFGELPSETLARAAAGGS